MQLKTGACFFEGLALCRFAGRLIVFHKSCGQGPVTAPRFDRAFAKEDLGFSVALPYRDGPDNHFGVLVMNDAALVANITRPRIVRGNQKGDRLSALGTEFHE